MRNVSRLDWFHQQNVSWDDKYAPTFTEIRTIRGMGFVFNSIATENLLNFSK
jgi:hypothetical protein